ncbi:hypothetical protein BX600DRAFT_512590 [Xylariales sp. PMI_506]|nr:hypothetical protein BX600DRAFT_512590 [Xylariales sp. PMI_506]
MDPRQYQAYTPAFGQALSRVPASSTLNTYMNHDQGFERRAQGITTTTAHNGDHASQTSQMLQHWDHRWTQASSRQS